MGNKTGTREFGSVGTHIWEGWEQHSRNVGGRDVLQKEHFYFAEAEKVGISINMGGLTPKPKVAKYMSHSLGGEMRDINDKLIQEYPPTTAGAGAPEIPSRSHNCSGPRAVKIR